MLNSFEDISQSLLFLHLRTLFSSIEIFNQIVYFLRILVLGSLKILDNNKLPDRKLERLFFPLSAGCLVTINTLLSSPGASSFWWLCILCPVLPGHPEVYPLLFPLEVSGLTLKSLICFNLIFIQVERWDKNFISLHATIQDSQHCLLNMLSFLQCVFLTYLSKIGWI